MRTLLFLLFTIVMLPASAADSPATISAAKDKATVPEPPPPLENYNPPAAPDLPGSEATEPEVTITTKGTEIHEEYRMSGRLYMIKITPSKGKPYYLIDHEGSGKFRRDDFQPRL